jgi:hypothetical protein
MSNLYKMYRILSMATEMCKKNKHKITIAYKIKNINDFFVLHYLNPDSKHLRKNDCIEQL